MKKAISVILAVLMCLYITGCNSSKIPNIYQIIATEFLNGIGSTSLEEVKSYAESTNLKFEKENTNNSYKISNGGKWDVSFYFSYDDRLSVISFQEVEGERSIHISRLTICYTYGENDKRFSTLADCEQYVFGAVSGIDYTVEEKEEAPSSSSPLSDNSNFSSFSTPNSSVPKEDSFDSLQNLFISITSSTTVENLNQRIKDKSLCYTSQDYNSSLGKEVTYVIAYSEGVAAQKYADSGDYLEVTFQKSSGIIMTAQYVNAKCPSSALYYNFGYWYDFRDREPGSYSGYYIVDPFAKNTGITIKYNNGNEKATNYFRKSSATNAIQAILDKI